ncbi:MerR family transcriptional regulator [Demequina sp. NBRC 110054]|uniref:MerR family transcriptional regulator n=1 Tax=Demequina sp. NBRC 110054 TaxID=1570343 RepID=UPI0011785D1B|nr:MerR family transcriptional regulator [Demequina sp. NBRC 110054]
MRSAEAARLAGVTPRTLRHYHQLGVVEEPPRSANGYREYSIEHVARVIRIRRLADLGVPLERTPDLLDGAADADAELHAIDEALADQIVLLERRRAELAEIRASRRAPDLAAEVAPFVEALTDGLTAELAALATHEMVLGYQVTPKAQRGEYARVMAPILEPEVRGRLRGLNVRLSEISDDASDAEVQALARDIVRFNLDDLPRTDLREQTASQALALEAVDAYWAAKVRPVQTRVIAAAGAAVAAEMAAR